MWKKWIKRTALAGLLVVLAGVCGLFYLAWSRVPDLNGTVVHPSLVGPVTVIRDNWGVPHIEAEHEADAFFALGYVMAQDRLFQMEVLRRIAGGRTAEVVGEASVPLDAIIRSFQLRSKAVETASLLQTEYPELYAPMAAFVTGINHRISAEALPFEFAVLGLEGEPFTVVDCLSIGALLPITFADGLRGDPLQSMLQERLPDHDVPSLFPGYHREIPVTVMETLEEARVILQQQAETSRSAGMRDTAGLEALLAHLNPISEAFGPALGSNSWVLGPSRSKSGKAILANDPHIAFTNPSIWYEAQITLPDHRLYGYYLPLIPLALLGQNDHHAWGLTMFANDDLDLFRETFHPEDPSRVKYRGAWTAVESREEIIGVRWGDDVPVTLRRTPHGPVITDMLAALLDYDGPDLALHWAWQQLDYTDMVAFYRMGRARSYDDFAGAVSLITSPGINVSYADADDNIAWWAAGRIPIRPDHVNHKALLDGASGTDEWLGYVPFAENPHLKNPPWGYIVTANNKSTVNPVGAVKDLEGYWQPGDRAGRIEAMLAAQERWSLEELKALQVDSHAYAAPKLLPLMVAPLEARAASLNAVEQAALEILRTWDFEHGTTSGAGALYQVYGATILRAALLDEMGETLFTTYGSLADHWNFFKWFMTEPASKFWDDIHTDAVETREDILLRAFRQAVDYLVAHLGEDVGTWQWGDLHQLEFKHPFGYLPGLDWVFNIGPYPVSGGAQQVNNMLYNGGGLNFDVVAGPSTRRLIDFANPTEAYGILPTGNSGNFMSPHYDDQAAMFIAGQYRLLHSTPDVVAAHAEARLAFRP